MTEVIAIDGPAASGKSTAARGVAEALGFGHLNSGFLYRAITWAALEDDWIDADGELFGRRVAELDLVLLPRDSGYRTLVGGRDPGEAFHSAAVTGRVSEVAARAPVRRRVLAILRSEATRRSLVCDGRDIGTVVFPGARLKIFLVASPEERARRRLGERGDRLTSESVAEETARIRARDRADSTRELAPLRPAEDAVRLDNTNLEPEEVVARITALARERGLERE